MTDREHDGGLWVHAHGLLLAEYFAGPDHFAKIKSLCHMALDDCLAHGPHGVEVRSTNNVVPRCMVGPLWRSNPFYRSPKSEQRSPASSCTLPYAETRQARRAQAGIGRRRDTPSPILFPLALLALKTPANSPLVHVSSNPKTRPTFFSFLLIKNEVLWDLSGRARWKQWGRPLFYLWSLEPWRCWPWPSSPPPMTRTGTLPGLYHMDPSPLSGSNSRSVLRSSSLPPSMYYNLIWFIWD